MSIVWALWGYSLAFGDHTLGGFVGDGQYLCMQGVLPYYDAERGAAVYPMTGSIPTLIHMVYQMMFFIITPALICGAFAERMRFSAMVLFSILWGTLVYCPLCHWVWGGGMLAYGVDGALLGGARSGYSYSGGVLWTNAFLAWWACLFTGRMPEGLRDLNLYALRYGAQTGAYALLITDRYPDADPFVEPTPAAAPHHPVRLTTAEDDMRRSRLTVFFRLLLAIPHFVWLLLWSIAVDLCVIVGWFAALFTGQVPQWVHNFVSRFVRYYTHVSAFVVLAANPFPGFTGLPGSYPIDVEIDERALQNRWKTGFRIILAIPALAVSGGLGGAMFIAAFLGWFAALITGRMPRNLRQAQVLALRYGAQLYGYVLLLTDRYPFASPAPPASSTPIP
jgi:hypothetical protein